MRKLVSNYTFDASEKTVTFIDSTSISLIGILLITNVTDNIIIYDFTKPVLGGTVVDNVLTLTYNTTTMDDTDSLQIWYDDGYDIMVNGKSTGSWYPIYLDDLSLNDKANLRVDNAGNLVTRSVVLTDEGSHYEPFPGSSLAADWETISETGTSITVENSICTLASGTTDNSTVSIFREVDFPPLDLTYSLNISQRIENQDIYFGYADHATTPSLDTMFARFHTTGTDSSIVSCETKSSDDTGGTETTSVILPFGILTSQEAVYRISNNGRIVRFYVGLTLDSLYQVAAHSTQIPDPYTVMYQRVRCVNGTDATSSTLINIDSITTNNYNIVNTESEVSGKVSINQSVIVSVVNSSVTNINAGQTFTGKVESTLGIAGIQVNLKSDQDCLVYVDQSIDGINWDITDEYLYYIGIGNFGITTQATGSYFRIRVTNNSPTNTTYFRLQTVLCPIVEAVPRSLSSYGNLKTKICEISDLSGFPVKNTPTGEMRSITPFKLAGASFLGTVLDPNFWTASLGTGGTATVGGAQLILSTGTGIADNVTSVQSVIAARYIASNPNRFRCTGRLPDIGTANNTRRLGAFTTANGCFFQLSGTTFSVVTRKTSSVNDIVVSNGSFNGVYGSAITLDTNVHTFEIVWTNVAVYFFIDDILLHKVTSLTTTWADTLTLPIRIENNNSGGSSTDVSLNIRGLTISRLGSEYVQPRGYYRAGTVTAQILKYGAGNLHGIIISGITDNAVVTLYDNTTNSGTIIWSSGGMLAGTTNVPYGLDFKGIQFSIGLTLAITTSNCNVTVMYD